MRLAPLEDGLHPGLLVQGPVLRPHPGRGGVNHHVGLREHLFDAAGDGQVGLLEARPCGHVGEVERIPALGRYEGLGAGVHLGDPDHLHVVLGGHCVRDPLSDGTVSVDCDPDHRACATPAAGLTVAVVSGPARSPFL